VVLTYFCNPYCSK